MVPLSIKKKKKVEELIAIPSLGYESAEIVGNITK